MEKFWNFLFYATWITLGELSTKLVFNPINNFVVKIYPKNRKKGFKNYQNHIKSLKKSEKITERSINITHAFRFMLLSTSIFIGVVLIVINYFIDFQFQNSALFGLFGAVSLSLFINYYYLYRNNNYLIYFKLFQHQQTPINNYVIAFIFHVIPFLLLIFLA